MTRSRKLIDFFGRSRTVQSRFTDNFDQLLLQLRVALVVLRIEEVLERIFLLVDRFQSLVVTLEEF